MRNIPMFTNLPAMAVDRVPGEDFYIRSFLIGVAAKYHDPPSTGTLCNGLHHVAARVDHFVCGSLAGFRLDDGQSLPFLNDQIALGTDPAI